MMFRGSCYDWISVCLNIKKKMELISNRDVKQGNLKIVSLCREKIICLLWLVTDPVSCMKRRIGIQLQNSWQWLRYIFDISNKVRFRNDFKRKTESSYFVEWYLHDIVSESIEIEHVWTTESNTTWESKAIRDSDVQQSHRDSSTRTANTWDIESAVCVWNVIGQVIG